MFENFRRDDLVSFTHLNELLQKLNMRPAQTVVVEKKKDNTWVIVSLVALGFIIAGVVVYKLFFSGDDAFDTEDEDDGDFEEDFEDIDYEDDFEDEEEDFEENQVVEDEDDEEEVTE